MLKLKTYPPAEERLNVWTHGIAALLMLPGLLWMLSCSRNGLEIFGCTIYNLALMVMFGCSACYHKAKSPQARLKLRRADHAAIYLAISGTYTPLFLYACKPVTAAVILSISWGIAALGITKELFNFKLPKYISIISYLVSGWLCIFAAHELIARMSIAGVLLILAGGIAYTAGVPFYLSRRKYAHALWHLFVIAGVILHYCAISTLL